MVPGCDPWCGRQRRRCRVRGPRGGRRSAAAGPGCGPVWSVSGGGAGLRPGVVGQRRRAGLRPLVWSVSGGGAGLRPLVWSVSGGGRLRPLVWSVSGGGAGLRPRVVGQRRRGRAAALGEG